MPSVIAGQAVDRLRTARCPTRSTVITAKCSRTAGDRPAATAATWLAAVLARARPAARPRGGASLGDTGRPGPGDLDVAGRRTDPLTDFRSTSTAAQSTWKVNPVAGSTESTSGAGLPLDRVGLLAGPARAERRGWTARGGGRSAWVPRRWPAPGRCDGPSGAAGQQHQGGDQRGQPRRGATLPGGRRPVRSLASAVTGRRYRVNR